MPGVKHIQMKNRVLQLRLKESFEKFDGAVALDSADCSLSYGELHRRTEAIAARLHERGVEPEMFIGVLVEDRLDLIMAIIGILKAGCVFVPLDTGYPENRLEVMIDTTDMELIIGDRKNVDHFQTRDMIDRKNIQFIRIDRCTAEVEAVSPSRPCRREACYSPEDKVYIYYTSGTTGIPKAIVGRNASLLHFVDWEIKTFGIDETFRFSQFTNPGFDVFLRDIFVPLCAGGTVCIPQEKGMTKAAEFLVRWLDKKSINLIHCVPSLFRFLNADGLNRDRFKSLKYVLLAGEKVIPRELSRWYDTFSERIQLVNLYGPTETTLAKLFYPIQMTDTARERMPVGKHIDGARAIILKENMQPCGRLMAGEIYIRTAYRSYGYLNDPEMNARRFVPNPFNKDPADRLYKTGDLGLLLPEGHIELLGRIDRQVKIQGIRVELDEIENLIIRHPAVEEAVVVKREITAANEVLSAFITCSQQGRDYGVRAGDLISSLRQFLEAELPVHLLPANIHMVEQIPRKPNGKVDYDRIMEMIEDSKTEYVAPGNEIENKLARIWAEILGYEEVGVTHSFFELGGNSLGVMSLIAGIQRHFEVKVTLRDMFENLTVRQQAAFIGSSTGGSADKIRSVSAVEEKEYYPLASVQKRLYFLNRMDTEAVGYNLPQAFMLEGDLSPERLDRVFGKLVRRHDSFRTSFRLIDNRPVQIVHREIDFRIEYVTPDENPAGPVVEDFIKPFDLACAPLLRLKLVKTGLRKFILMIDMHHIIADGMSREILVQDFVTLYRGEGLSPLKIRYKDYAEWRNSEIEREKLKSQEQFWLESLAGRLPVLDLPLDFPRPTIQSFAGSALEFQIGSRETAGLKRLAERQGATLYMVLVALYSIFLAKLGGREDILIGTTSPGREPVAPERVMGMFVNTLVLYNHPGGNSTFVEFLGEVKDRVLEAFENRDYPFEDLVEKLAVRREIGRNPLFDVMLVWQNLEVSGVDIPGLKLEPYRYEERAAKFDLSLQGMEAEDRLDLRFEYSTRLFRKETAARFAAYFREIAASAAGGPGKPVDALEIIPAAERRRILADFNDTRVEFGGDRTMDVLFAEQVAAAPDHTAVRFVQVQLSYAELERRASRLAGVLQSKGVKPNTIVGLMADSSPELVVGMVGILNSAGAYLPIPPEYPPARRDYMLTDSRVELLVASRSAAGEFELDEIEIVYIVGHGTVGMNSGNPGENVAPPDLFYVVYTSGSTGRPKGVPVRHSGFVNLVYAHRKIFRGDNRSRMSQVASIGFDAMAFEVWPCLVWGACLCLADNETRREPERMREWLIRNRITISFQPTIMTEQLLKLEWPEGGIPLRALLAAGDRLRRCPSAERPFELHNLYGPTEDTVWTTWTVVAVRENTEGQPNPPIGKPIANKKTYILGRNLELLPIGAPGELCIGGEGVAPGYLNRPDLTAERFVENPCNPVERVYRTGDRARWLPDGNIDFLGRLDTQVKLRGYRIELGEIESLLAGHDAIEGAVVVLRGEEEGDRYLCAYFVSRTEFEEIQLKEYLLGKLPAYMIPAFFIRLEKLPLTAAGKIDRRSLPHPAGRSLASGIDYVPPASPMERRLAEVWKEVLGRDKIGVNDNFFMIGGDSIKSIQIASRMNETGYRLELTDIFRFPSLSTLAPRVVKVERLADQSIVSGRVPLTPIQREFFERSDIAPHHYNQAVMFFEAEGFDPQAVKAVLAKIQEHHDALRMSYKEEEGRIIQTNHGRDYPLWLQTYDLRGRKSADEVLKARIDEIQAGINLDTGPLLKSALFRMDDGDRMLIVVHHLVIDGVSWRILFEDIENLYRRYQEGQKFSLPPKTDSFKVWAEALTGYAAGKSILQEKSYWARLESIPVPDIPRDFRNGTNYRKDAVRLSFSLAEDQTNHLLLDVNRAFGTEINDILLTSLALGIRQTFGNEKLLIAVEGHGREHIAGELDVSRTVGWFTSVYPLLLEVFHSDDLERQIKEIKERLRQVPRKGIGYGILKYLTPDENIGEIDFTLNPRIGFNYLGQFDEDVKQLSFRIADESVGTIQCPDGQREYELEVSGLVTGKRLVMSIVFNEKQFKKETVSLLLNHFHSELCRTIAFCLSRETRTLTPADLTYKAVPMDLLDRLAAQYHVEDIYPLSPMQEGMLFHALYAPSSAAYFMQISYRLRGKLQVSRVKESLQVLTDRHEVLRTAFIHEGLDRPLQVVLADRRLDVYFEDIQVMAAEAEIDAYIREFKEKDRRRRFDLDRGRLMRISIIRLTESEYEFIWSFHHILMDGWCTGILIREYFQIYQTLLEGKMLRLPPVKPYRAYIEWIEQQDREKSREYWRSYLQDYSQAVGISRINRVKNSKGDYKNEQLVDTLTEKMTADLNTLSARNLVTLNTTLQAAWGILLGKYNGKRDVVFGVAVSGRPAEVEGVETMVGLFTNTIPVRLRYEGHTRFNELLRSVQQGAADSGPHHHYPLADIQSQSILKQELLDHILVFESFPDIHQRGLGAHTGEQETGSPELDLLQTELWSQTNYDFNFIIAPARRLKFRLMYNACLYEREFIDRTLRHFLNIIEQVISDETIVIDELELLTAEERRELIDRVKHRRGRSPFGDTKNEPGRLDENEADFKF